MSQQDIPAKELLNKLIREVITSILKPANFRKSGMNFHRRFGETVQVVNIQVSQGSSANDKQFYVNVGVAFDAICQLVGLPILENPKEYECSDRGTRDRMETLIPETPDRWHVRTGDDINPVAMDLQSRIATLRSELDRINCPAAYRSHRWFNRFRPTPENAQLLYILGDLDGAREEVMALVELFADRQNANRPEFWFAELGLKSLENG